MSWGLGWKRPSEIFHLALSYNNEELMESPSRVSSSFSTSLSSSMTMGLVSQSSSASSIVAQDQELGFQIELKWSAGDNEEGFKMGSEQKDFLLKCQLATKRCRSYVGMGGFGKKVHNL
ncbi:hypothetical protein CMV_008597 [Castanea mollissima]|uniref:Uncharacterized protein n=1 Tax=Castanea mollissima TaxID=60419 RepID=A0A8J4VRP4_9ROSI|nr:hypothetical protein CMV_008597 [Castanea mollissima]